MKQYIRAMSLIMGLSLLMSCQYFPADSFFKFSRPDAQVTTAVYEALKNDPDLEPFTFHIETADGVVYLSGYVKTIRQADGAAQLAQRVSGVKSVENNIIVRK